MRSLVASFVGLLSVCVTSCGGGSATPTAATPTSPTGTCAFAISSLAVSVGATSGPTQLTVTTTNGCAWTAVSSQAFLAITSGSGATGTGTVTFTVAANTGAQRAANITVGGQTVVVTQLAAAAQPLAFAAPAPPAGAVGVAYNFNFAVATGGTEPIRYQLETGCGFPPIGLVLGTNGTLSGTPTVVAANTPFSVCAVDATGRSVCSGVRMSVTQLNDDLVANWAGSIVLRAGCITPLPFGYPWTGTIRRTAGGALELEITIPLLTIDRDRVALTVNGSAVSFTEQYGPYVFRYVGTLASDRRSVNGTFVGDNCGPAPGTQQSGTWSGAQQ
jgi:hypothetical protein